MAEAPYTQAHPSSLHRSPSDEESRIDSAVEISPTEPPTSPSPPPPLRTSHIPQTSRDTSTIIPPRITGHGRLVYARQTIPGWMGALIVAGVFAWTVWCAVYAYPLLGGHGNEDGPRRGLWV